MTELPGRSHSHTHSHNTPPPPQRQGEGEGEALGQAFLYTHTHAHIPLREGVSDWRVYGTPRAGAGGGGPVKRVSGDGPRSLEQRFK